MSRSPTYWRPTLCQSAPTGRRGVGPPGRPAEWVGRSVSLLTAVVDSVPAGRPSSAPSNTCCLPPHRLSDVRAATSLLLLLELMRSPYISYQYTVKINVLGPGNGSPTATNVNVGLVVVLLVVLVGVIFIRFPIC